MELPSQEAEMPIPLNSTYGVGHAHMIHHHPPPPNNHIIPSPNPSSGAPITPSPPLDHHVDQVIPFKKLVKYRECLKNHAASMGGNATDGCGEFMPSGEEGTLEALTCSACNCHRNFHRKEIEGGDNQQPNNSIISPCDNCYNVGSRIGRKVFVGHHRGGFVGPDAIGYHHHPSRAHVAPPPHQMIMSYNMGGGGNCLPSEPPQMVKKRFRTKFTQEQKEKMLSFAERVGWKIQKQEEGVVQQFCQEVGVKRRVLKVWMHNNKHNLAKKNLGANSENQV
ncbi:hypothetical protein DH2020_003087 [Rehmannia glutinosa]|uniref:ZF-HD dimerization-type domain-containing protein n=1 Tax=Rehmannia glutinosa TaxID=99300 RepID=A0ABR0XL32_REHGL